jgi:hypothetical protein
MNVTRRALWLLIVGAVGAVFLALPDGARAADPNATYAGTMSDGGTVTLTTSADGKSVAVALRYVASSVPAGCSPGLNGTPGLGSNGNQFGMSNGEAAGGTRAFFSGPEYGAVAGVTTVIPPSGSNCPARYLLWRADRVPAVPVSAKPAAALTYSGSVYAIEGGDVTGSVQVTTDANGTVNRFILSATNAGCQYSVATEVVLLTNNTAQRSGTGGALSMAIAPSVDGTRVTFAGGFVADGAGACPKFSGTWIAAAPRTVIPTVTNPGVADTGQGRFVATPAFGSGSQALAVFGGGAVDQLEAAARTAGGTGVWAQDQTGGFVLLVVGGPSFINDAFRTKFSAGLAPNTAVTLTK